MWDKQQNETVEVRGPGALASPFCSSVLSFSRSQREEEGLWKKPRDVTRSNASHDDADRGKSKEFGHLGQQIPKRQCQGVAKGAGGEVVARARPRRIVANLAGDAKGSGWGRKLGQRRRPPGIGIGHQVSDCHAREVPEHVTPACHGVEEPPVDSQA
ncbi:hypothetical protein PG993_003697 [Apiospora rasikravindrae]|uniref:Uncharacterized protein n=1 Tax=Apiospora rasikravindrae TaxID=990691 RepID=A0ABR1U0T8_9PEZI